MLRRLQELARRSPFEVAIVRGDRLETVWLTCTLRPPASAEAVAEAELRLGVALPDDYDRFLMISDGATLFADGGAAGRDLGSGAELLGAAALVRQAERTAADLPDCCIPETLVFTTLGGSGDGLAFAVGRVNPHGGCAVLDARASRRPEQWWVISRDFTTWLEGVLRDTIHPRSWGRSWDEEGGEQPPLPLGRIDLSTESLASPRASWR